MQEIINEEKIFQVLERAKNPSRIVVCDVFKKALDRKGLDLEEVAVLLNICDEEDVNELFRIAALLKDEIYGERIVLFAPLYISDFCVNDCQYCNFHTANTFLKRRQLTQDEIKEQVNILVNMGHKRVLLELGEDSLNNSIDYVVEAIESIYSVKAKKGNIRRINVNIAATTVENYRKLKAAKIGTYQLFQETYHRKTYEALHRGPKADYDRQITAHIRAFEAGIDDVGLGVLFGLYDWRFEVLALISHAQYLDKNFNVGPHTISVPRFQKAPTVDLQPNYQVSDNDFLKLIAILRLAVPYTGLILSTRESPELRHKAFKIGVSQASAGSKTTIGGYIKEESQPQFTVQDERSLEEVVKGLVESGFIPSFCTGCYRSNRTGETFMKLAKPGGIHNFCRPNGLLTFAEYLEDFSKNGLYDKGYALIDYYLNKIDDARLRQETQGRLDRIKVGERDLFV